METRRTTADSRHHARYQSSTQQAWQENQSLRKPVASLLGRQGTTASLVLQAVVEVFQEGEARAECKGICDVPPRDLSECITDVLPAASLWKDPEQIKGAHTQGSALRGVRAGLR